MFAQADVGEKTPLFAGAKQWGRNREEAESNNVRITEPEKGVKRNFAKITINSVTRDK